ncbi:preprotein translocase subunit SecG, partial [Brucella inopinata BO1]
TASRPTDILIRIPATTGSQRQHRQGGSTNGGGILDQLGGEPSGSGNGAAPAAPAAPAQPDAGQPQAPAAPANPVPSSQ